MIRRRAGLSAALTSSSHRRGIVLGDGPMIPRESSRGPEFSWDLRKISYRLDAKFSAQWPLSPEPKSFNA
jgi:hypothetical protein